MDEERKKANNLRLLQRSCNCPTLTELYVTATHVVLYEFTGNNWKKCDKEGSLFVAAYPYTLIILNRTSTDNFVLTVDKQLQIQHQEPYLILKKKKNSGNSEQQEQQQILGIWFHNADERIQVNDILQEAVQKLRDGHVPTPPAPPAPAAPPTAAAPAQAVTPAGVDSTTTTEIAAMSLKHALGIIGGGGEAQPAAASAAPAASSSEPTPATASATLLPSPPQQPNNNNNNIADSTTTTMNGGGGNNSHNPAVVLDKKSLQLALLSLLQEDRFLDLIHSQYLRVVKTRTAKQQLKQQQKQNQQKDDE